MRRMWPEYTGAGITAQAAVLHGLTTGSPHLHSAMAERFKLRQLLLLLSLHAA